MSIITKERVLRSILPAIAGMSLLAFPAAAAQAQRPSAETVARQAWERSLLQRRIAEQAPRELRPFYAGRQFQPLWLNELGRPSGAASMLMHHLRTAQTDGIDPRKIRFDRLVQIVDRARRGDEEDIARAEIELTRGFAAYVQAMRAAPRQGMIYESAALQPVVPTTSAVLEAAAAADSLEHYIAEMRWMHPLYAPLRDAMDDVRMSETQRQVIWANLERIRAIPAMAKGRHIVVDAAGARLWMYEDGNVVDSMKVVVGKPDLQTPMMAGFVRHAILNPYWNVPDDLVQTNIAANVLSRGVNYLKNGGYQVFASWDEGAPMLDPKTVDWRAVREGRAKVRVRQLPGGANFMGKVKFEFPNDQGIYLHDTPDKHLLKLAERQQSSGCVRLEDAARMHRWLMDKPMPARVARPEQFEALPEMVPIYITYLTAVPAGSDQRIAFQSDPYGRDRIQFAAINNRLARADRP